jgi:hypothetical protein
MATRTRTRTRTCCELSRRFKSKTTSPDEDAWPLPFYPWPAFEGTFISDRSRPRGDGTKIAFIFGFDYVVPCWDDLP